MFPANQNIFLIGPMGSGKTTIGRLVARKLGLAFHDSDLELEKLTGASINLIFDVEGEPGFRERETRVLRTLAKKKGVLVATGGGAVKSEENRQLLRRSGLVVWLKADIEQQLARLSHDKSRPLLQTHDKVASLHKLARERNPLYRATADLEFESRNCSSRNAAKALVQLLEEQHRAADSGKSRANR